MVNQRYPLFFSLVFCIFSFCAKAQQQTARYIQMSEATKAFYEYLPQGYPEPGKKYPLLLFIHGLGESGQGTTSSLPLVLRHGPPKLINNGTFPLSFTVNNETFKFIVISPQFTGFPSVNDINNSLNYLTANYAVDINRIYITGLSMGGGVAWYYPGYNAYFANRVAATVPVCGATEASPTYALNIATANLPVWATHNIGDPTISVNVTNTLVTLINTASIPPTPLARKTIFTGNSHDAWTQTYNPAFKENGLNIYEWMLQYHRNFVVLPVTGLQFYVSRNALNQPVLQWSSITEINLYGYDIEKSTDGTSFYSIGTMPATGGSSPSYHFTDAAITTGRSFYRLRLRDADGQENLSEIREITLQAEGGISLFPNPVKNMLNISGIAGFSKTTIRVFNAMGRQVKQYTGAGSPVISLQLNGLPAGQYYIELQDEMGTQRGHFLKL